MGENNCAWSRRLRIPHNTLMAAAAIYKGLKLIMMHIETAMFEN